MTVDNGRPRLGGPASVLRPVRAGAGPMAASGSPGAGCPGSPGRRASPRTVGTSSGTLGSPKRQGPHAGALTDRDGADQAGGLIGLVHTIEQLSTLEATLWSILEGLRSSVTYVSYFCREYWGTSASKAQLSLDRLDWNDRLKQQVQQACVLESLSMAVTSSLASGTMQDVSEATRSRLCSLLTHIHQNCLVLMDLVRQRWQPGTSRADSLKDDSAMANLDFDILTRADRYRQLHRGEHVMALKQHNEVILNIVRQLCRGATRKPMLPKSRGSAGDLSPGSPPCGRGGRGAGGGVLGAVNDVLSSSSMLDRSRPMRVRKSMLQCLRFLPLLSNGNDADSPWPTSDPYERFGMDLFASDGPVVWFEPLPPMMADLERRSSLPPPPSPDAYTLVLDLDETLVHYYEVNGAGNYGVRPGMSDFLRRMHQLGFELVIFTAATQDYADWVIGQIDPEGLIHHRLYRQHALPWGPLFAKDLSRLGRDLDRTIIIDNVQENFMKHPKNGIFICTWYDDPQDTALTELTPLLEELITTKAKVPDILEKYRDQIPLWAGFGQPWDCSGAAFDGESGLDEGFASADPATPQPLDPGGYTGTASDAHLQPAYPGHSQASDAFMQPPYPGHQQAVDAHLQPAMQGHVQQPISLQQFPGACLQQPCPPQSQAPQPLSGTCTPQPQVQPPPQPPQQPVQAWAAGTGPYQAQMPIQQQAPQQWAPAPQQGQRQPWGAPFKAGGITGSYQYVPPTQAHPQVQRHQQHLPAQHQHRQHQHQQFLPQQRR
uniref:FCP1 homology domain-containing protein n=1 Tax=Alexandrium monilatum TaxID=311494 RepID=A0A7S4UPE6_9DINO